MKNKAFKVNKNTIDKNGVFSFDWGGLWCTAVKLTQTQKKEKDTEIRKKYTIEITGEKGEKCNKIQSLGANQNK